jgi:preprotein translocase subunit SecG
MFNMIVTLCVVIIALGLLLSGSGSSSGLVATSGQDLELFRKTKDRGLIK